MKNLLLTLFGICAFCICKAQILCQNEPPPIVAKPVTENYFGVDVIDEYRNLENIDDSLVKKWYRQQTIYADTILNSITGVDSLMNKMKERNNRQAYYIQNINNLENGNYFYLKKEKGEKKYRLYYNKEYDNEEILLYDPNDFQPENGNDYTINYIKPSWEGKFVLVSLSHSGKELSEMIIIDVEKNNVLPQIIDKAWPSSFLGVSWLPDSSGFIYLQFPITDINDKGFKKNTQSVLYNIGDNPNTFKVLISSSLNPSLNLQENDYPIVTIKSKDDPFLVAYIASVGNFWDAYILPNEEVLEQKILWKPFYSKDEMVLTNSGVFNDGSYIYKSAMNASNFKICSVSLDSLNFGFPEILVNEKQDEVIDDFEINVDGLFYATVTNGVEGNLYHFSDMASKKINLPKKSGKINLSSQGLNSDKLWVNLTGWVTSDERYSYSFSKDKFETEELTPKSGFKEFENFVVDEIQIPSHDGVLIPVSIIYNSKLKLNGSNPTLFYGYGAYGDALNPFFSPLFLTWIEEGGVLCIPHVRGGGEKGDSWHKAGYKNTKMNTWKDLIATVEFMIDKKYTSQNNTVVYSSSAGGIMVGRAITERPELFAASIVDVGVLNPLRRESFSGSSNYKEYGTVTDSIEFKGLLAMDSYAHLKKGVKYPAGLYITGMNDPRVAPWMTGKFVAKIQAYTISNKPILYKVDADAGHSNSASFDDVYRKWAEMFAFGLWQAGHPKYIRSD